MGLVVGFDNNSGGISGRKAVPSGGLEGQVLTKKSDANYDVEWDDTVDAEPVGSVTPLVDPYEYATKVELEELADDTQAEISQLGQEVTDIQEELPNKANVDGVYETLVAGGALSLVAKTTVESEFTFDKIPAAADDGAALLKMVKGKSLVWNQLVQIPSADVSITQNGVTITDNRDGSFTVQTDANGATDIVALRIFYLTTNYTARHSFFVRGCPSGGSANTFHLRDAFWGQAIDTGDGAIYSPGLDNGVQKFVLAIRIQSGAIITTPITFRPIVTDLTLMFGAGNEPTTVAEFEKLFPQPYYDYNAGNIKNNMTTAVKFTGLNQWDEEWESGVFNRTTGAPVADASHIRSKNFCPARDIFTYYLNFPAGKMWSILWYDAEYNYIDYNAGTGPSSRTPYAGAAYFKFYADGTTYNHDICINISDANRNGEYEPYKTNIIALNLPALTGKLNGEGESVVVYPDGMKAVNNLYDEAAGSKAVVRFAEVDMGDLNWTKYQNNIFISPRGSLAQPAAAGMNALCAKYKTVDATGFNADKAIAIGLADIVVGDSDYANADAATFKAAMAGVKLIYELETPLEYTLDTPLPETFQAYKGGTMQQLPENTSAPTTAPMVMEWTGALDAVSILTGLPQNYVSKESLQAMLGAMQSAGLFASYTMTFDETNNRYSFTFTPNPTE